MTHAPRTSVRFNPRCAESVPRRAYSCGYAVEKSTPNPLPCMRLCGHDDTYGYALDGANRIYTPAVGGSKPSAPTGICAARGVMGCLVGALWAHFGHSWILSVACMELFSEGIQVAI